MSEYYTTRNYIDWLLDIPWDKEDKSEMDLNALKAELESSHYGLDEVKDRILEYLAVQRLNGNSDGSILCLVSPPGCGKTSIAKSISKALGRKFVKISLGGVRDEADIRGHRRTYIGSMPGKVIQALKQAGSMNPVVLLDEIDKMGSDHVRGSPAAALLEVLDPEQNKEFMDHFINMGVDLSKIFFVATGNDKRTIDRALIDRLEVIDIEGYSGREKAAIAKRYLLPEIQKETNIPNNTVEIPDDAVCYIIDHYTMESGVRDLRRKIQTIFRKVARKIVTGEKVEKIVVTPAMVPDYLGPERIHNDKINMDSAPGISFGLAWNGAGGDVLPIECITLPGDGKFNITGNLGKVMEESVKVGLAYLKGHAASFGLTKENFNQDFHFHFPEGAISKDGPSAGSAITMAIMSKLKDTTLPKDTAFTGEITTHGAILAVGGIKEKVMAAKRNGVKNLYIPRSNKLDVDKLDAKDVEGLTFNYVSNFREVYNKFWKGA
jgi:ATP-dependent Lon protease